MFFHPAAPVLQIFFSRTGIAADRLSWRSVISLLQRVTLVDTANLPGSAIQVGVRRKVAFNLSDCWASGLDFIPLIVETLGGWSEEAISTIRSIGRFQGQRLAPLTCFDSSPCGAECLPLASPSIPSALIH